MTATRAVTRMPSSLRPSPVIDARILSLAGDKGSELATGGMVTKLHAAQIATAAGCEMVIANGEQTGSAL